MATFGTGGVAPGPFAVPAAVAIEPSGRIIVAGVDTSSADEWAIASFEPDGTPDANFGTNGGSTGRSRATRTPWPSSRTAKSWSSAIPSTRPRRPRPPPSPATIPASPCRSTTSSPPASSVQISAAGGQLLDGSTESRCMVRSPTRFPGEPHRDHRLGGRDQRQPGHDDLDPRSGGDDLQHAARQYAASGQYIITVSVGDAAGSGPDGNAPRHLYTILPPRTWS